MTDPEPTIEYALASAWSERLLTLGFVPCDALSRSKSVFLCDEGLDVCLVYSDGRASIEALWQNQSYEGSCWVDFILVVPVNSGLPFKGYATVSPWNAYKMALELIAFLRGNPSGNIATRVVALAMKIEPTIDEP